MKLYGSPCPCLDISSLGQGSRPSSIMVMTHVVESRCKYEYTYGFVTRTSCCDCAYVISPHDYLGVVVTEVVTTIRAVLRVRVKVCTVRSVLCIGIHTSNPFSLLMGSCYLVITMSIHSFAPILPLITKVRVCWELSL